MGDMWEDSDVGDEAPEMEAWHTDRSRYMAGYACEWKRLLGYHAFVVGLSTERQGMPLTVGIDVHHTLEFMLNNMAQGVDIDQALVNRLLQSPDRLLDYGQHTDDDDLKDARDIAFAIPHAYARIAIPWLRESFQIHSVEEELTHKHERTITVPIVPSDPTDPHMRIPRRVWFNSRPDFVARELSSEKLTVHDFKTASSYQEARELMTYADNVQMMINSAQVKEEEDLDYYPDYYVHILLKGNKWSNSPFVTAFHREGAPPMQQEDWQAKYWLPPAAPGGKKRSIGRAYTKKRVSEYHRIDDWVWGMDSAVCAEQIIILGPFNVVGEKVNQFMRALPDHEQRWLERTANIDWTQWADATFQWTLDQRFPRTFQCYSYGHRCEFYNLCFKGPGWDKPFENGYIEREPHHTQEPKGDVIK